VFVQDRADKSFVAQLFERLKQPEPQHRDQKDRETTERLHAANLKAQQRQAELVSSPAVVGFVMYIDTGLNIESHSLASTLQNPSQSHPSA